MPIRDNRPGATANPLLIVNTGHDGNTNFFITPTLVTNCQNRQDNRTLLPLKTTYLRQISRSMPGKPGLTVGNYGNQSPGCHVPDRCQITNHGEHQYQSTYTNQNRSYTNNYNQNYKHTWKITLIELQQLWYKGHIAKYCTKTSFWCQWCHTATQPHMIHKLADQNPRSSTPMESPSAGSYHPTQSPNQHNTSSHQPVLYTQHNHLQLHQAVRNGPNC